jgi:peptidoglycan hydrolase-like protein with peptidoglycan-binding domain
MSVLSVQQRLAAAGFTPGKLDGVWGRRTAEAMARARVAGQGASLAWGAKVSADFRAAVFELCERLGLVPDYLMACMAWESGETFSPRIRNGAGSGAVGLIQFMPATARALGTTADALATMTAEQQLVYVERYFKPYAGRLRTLSDHYMAILWPAAIGKPERAQLWDAATRPTTYRQNSGLDINRDRVITKAEAAAKVAAKLERGRQPGALWAN